MSRADENVLYDEPVRRFTLIAIIALLGAIIVAGIYQTWLAGKGERRFPGPGVSPTATP